MIRVTEKQIVAVLALPGPERYEHFVKRVADQSKLWGLWDNGWALMGTDDGKEALPVWPLEQYAKLHATGDWSNYKPREIEIHEFLDEWFPNLRESGTAIVVFPTPNNKGVFPDYDLLERDIRNELSRIE